jgi:hypothetical protein
MGGSSPERWSLPPPSPIVTEVAGERAPVAGAEMPAAGRSAGATARTAEVPGSAAGSSGSAAMVTTGAATAPAELLRKRKQGFSTLR